MSVNITTLVDIIIAALILLVHIAVSAIWTVVVVLNWMKQGLSVSVSRVYAAVNVKLYI